MKTITFYSYKGGVGRSLALANIATRLIEFDKRVCLLDFDLEAPGLPYKFSTRIPFSKGIVDYIYEYYVNGHLPETIKEYSRNFQILPNKQPVNFIAAGNTESTEYWKKLTAINWYNLLYESEHGIAFFLDLKEKIKQEFNPDFLLIDSRTGITETSGITMSILADEVVIIAANNRENMEGAKKIINSLSNKENSILGKELKITFVLSRIPFSDKQDDRSKEVNLIRNVKRFFDPKIVNDVNVIHSDRELEESERLKIGYDKEDYSSSQVSRDYLKLFEKLTQNDLSEEEIKKFEKIKLSEKFYAKSLSEEKLEQQLYYVNEAIKLDPENADFYDRRINLNCLSKNYNDAIPDCNTILKIKPDNYNAYFWLGYIYQSMGKYENAIDEYKKSVQIYPSNITYEKLGAAYEYLNDYNKAIESFTKAIELNPSSSQAYNGRANTYKLIGNIDSALNNVYKSIELNSGNYMAYSTLAEINAILKKENEFFINIEMALRLANEEKKLNDRSALSNIEKVIKNDNLYKAFYNNERFQKILEKYNIILLDDEQLQK